MAGAGGVQTDEADTNAATRRGADGVRVQAGGGGWRARWLVMVLWVHERMKLTRTPEVYTCDGFCAREKLCSEGI